MFSLSTIINTVFESLAGGTRKDKEIKGIQVGKEEVIVSIFADGMIIYISDFISLETSELINNFSKMSGFKINL